ncbi:MAG: aldo/keto reductase [Halobacteriales archaeon]|nr:aldo/keto reductase [Halobacteriales archaeon]
MEFETRSGVDVPAVGLGTWQLTGRTAVDAVASALELGYRHVDTAQAYGNEEEVGRAIADAAVDRGDVFLTTKVQPTHRSVEAIVDSMAASVDRLGVDAVDLALIHWPHPLADLETVMAGLDAVVDRGLARHHGVSNFGRDRLERAMALAEHPVLTDQVLFHPWWPQRELLEFCQAEGVVLTAYSPLANGGAIGDAVLREVGEAHGKTGPQVALRWAIEHDGVVAIPKSSSPAHQRENLELFDFALSEAERERITRPSYLKTGLTSIRGFLGI